MLERFVDERLDRAVSVDAGRLQQVLGNLLSNAIKFTHEGRVFVRAGLVERNTDRDLVRFTVTDSGVGVAREDMERLFKPFAQAGRGERGGTGLGLSISTRLVEAMGGQLEMVSSPGRGTTITFTIGMAAIKD